MNLSGAFIVNWSQALLLLLTVLITRLLKSCWKFKIETLLSLCLTTQLRDMSSCEGCFLIIIEVGVWPQNICFPMDIAR